MRHRRAWLATVVVLSLAGARGGMAADPGGQQGASQQPGEILWDTYGIPHIYGPDLLTVVRGYGYAQMENHAETLLLKIANARGRAAEYFGAGTGGANVANDTMVRTEGIPDRAAAWLVQGGLFQRVVLDAFVAGVNEYATRHGDTIAPTLRQVLPLVPTDILAAEQQAIQFTFMPEQDRVPDLVAAWQQGGLAAANALTASFTPAGSNGWALAPGKSVTGNAILLGNPHLPWGNNQPIPGLGIYQWMEANLVIGPPRSPWLNASGVAFVGAPFIGIGYTDDIGWTHTNNTIKNADLYELTLTASGGYLFGGATLPLQHRQDAIKIRQPDGSLVTQSLDVVFLGPWSRYCAERDQGAGAAGGRARCAVAGHAVLGHDRRAQPARVHRRERAAADAFLQRDLRRPAGRDHVSLRRAAAGAPGRDVAGLRGHPAGQRPGGAMDADAPVVGAAADDRPARRVRREQQRPTLDQHLPGDDQAGGLPGLHRPELHGAAAAERRPVPALHAAVHGGPGPGRQGEHAPGARRPRAPRPDRGGPGVGEPGGPAGRRRARGLGPQRRRDEPGCRAVRALV